MFTCCQSRISQGFWAPVGLLVWCLHLLFLICLPRCIDARKELLELRYENAQLRRRSSANEQLSVALLVPEAEEAV